MQQIKEENLETRIAKIEKELASIKVTLQKGKVEKVKLNELVEKISSKSKPVDTTALIRKMRNKSYTSQKLKIMKL